MSTGDTGAPIITEALLTNGAYGFPECGDKRRITPRILACVHQTAAGGTAIQYRDCRNTAAWRDLGKNTATYYVNPDGSAVHAIEASDYASWNSGILNRPDTSNPTVAWLNALVADPSTNYNANEGIWEQIECIGSGVEPWTEAQFVTTAWIIALRSSLSGLPIDRTTVIPHRDLDTVNRPSDPWPADRREARMAKLIALARTFAGQEAADMDLSKLAATVGAPCTAGSTIYDQLADGHNSPKALGISVAGVVPVRAIANRFLAPGQTQALMVGGLWPVAGGSVLGWGGADHVASPIAYSSADLEAAKRQAATAALAAQPPIRVIVPVEFDVNPATGATSATIVNP